ncbi:MAG: hypothetical protein Q9164_001721 [Protoblastenia rupestris]
MSASSTPIHPHHFAEAIADLPLGNLYLKVAEIQNSITHLEISNAQLNSFASNGDGDCADALLENQEVMRRMKERVALLKIEVERRGFRWGEDEGEGDEAQRVGIARANGHEENMSSVEAEMGSVQTMANDEPQGRSPGAQLGVEELAIRSTERVEEDSREDDGLHL